MEYGQSFLVSGQSGIEPDLMVLQEGVLVIVKKPGELA